jgi:dUTP pyrophosphatase
MESTEKKQWRFKTEEEFIKAYGDKFWHEYPWTSFMNYLFGMPLTNEQVKTGRLSELHPDACPHGDALWIVHQEYITADPLPQGYDFPHAAHEWRVKHGYAKEAGAKEVRLHNTIKVPIINNSRNPLPAYATVGAAGLDLMAELSELAYIDIPSQQWRIIPTGISIAIPEGYEGQVRPRSGLAAKHGVTVLNAPGTIDSDYRGEVKVVLINHSTSPFRVEQGMRIAQLVFVCLTPIEWEELDKDLDETERGSGGFGSTGMSK